MSGPPTGEEPGTARRARDFVARARRAPGAIDEVASEVAATQSRLDETRGALARLEELAWAGREDTRGGVTAVGEEIHALGRRIDELEDQLVQLDGAVASQATALHRAVAAPARRQVALALRDRLGAGPGPRPRAVAFPPCLNTGVFLG
ncbi:MAG: hypothetical protein ACR2JF_16605, partial [Iamia sp.]